jgi:hypothetical protein
MGQAASPSLYDFAGGDPVNHFDPDGRSPLINQIISQLDNWGVNDWGQNDYDPNPDDTGGTNASSKQANSPSNYGQPNNSRTIADNAFGNTTNMDCAPTSLRTIITTLTGNDPGISSMQDQVAIAENPNSPANSHNWNTLGTDLGAYAQTMTTVLNNNGVQAAALPNTDPKNPTANLTDLVNNVENAGGPSAVQVNYVDGSHHTITVQPQGSNILISNPVGNGGTITVPVSTFQSGQISVPGPNGGAIPLAIQPQYPIITATGKHSP